MAKRSTAPGKRPGRGSNGRLLPASANRNNANFLITPFESGEVAAPEAIVLPQTGLPPNAESAVPPNCPTPDIRNEKAWSGRTPKACKTR